MLPPGMVALQPQGTRESIFWIYYPCANLAKALGDDRPILSVNLGGLKGWMQHWPGVYPPEFEILKFFVVGY